MPPCYPYTLKLRNDKRKSEIQNHSFCTFSKTKEVLWMKDQTESFKSLNNFHPKSAWSETHFLLFVLIILWIIQMLLRSNFKWIIISYQFPVLCMSAQIPCNMIYKWLFFFFFFGGGRGGLLNLLAIIHLRFIKLPSNQQFNTMIQVKTCSHNCSIVYSISIYTNTYILLGSSYWCIDGHY